MNIQMKEVHRAKYAGKGTELPLPGHHIPPTPPYLHVFTKPGVL